MLRDTVNPSEVSPEEARSLANDGYIVCGICLLLFKPESTRQTRHDQCHAEYRKAYKRHHSKVYDNQKHRLSDAQLSEVRDHAMSDARDALKDG